MAFKSVGQTKRASIRSRLNGLVLGAVALSTLPVAGLFIARDTIRQAQARWDMVTAVATIVAGEAADATEANDRSRAFTVLRSVTRSPGLIYARIEDAHGRMLAETGAGARLHNDITLDATAPKADLKALIFSRTIRVVAPIALGRHSLGKVSVVQADDRFGASLFQALGSILAVAVLALGFALGLARRLQSSMTQPLADLTTAVESIADTNDFTKRVDGSTQDEIGALVRGVNTMLDAIRERDRKIEAQVRGLEAEVAARTADYKRARDAANAANAAKSDFLATMSHEIRTPMNGVMVMAELLAAETLPAKAQRYAQTIARSGRSLLAVINDILDFSKIEAGKLDLEIDCVDILELVDDSLALFKAKAREKGLELVAQTNPAAPRIVPADAVRLSQVISNIVSNALKFTETGGVIVRLEPERKGHFWRLIVIDTGIGIAEEKLNSIFTAFEQEDQTTTRRFGGTGLGLSIARRLVEAMGGAIAVTSVQGKGTAFHIRLPALPDARSAAPPLASGKTATVLIAAPEERKSLERRLVAAGMALVDDGDIVFADRAARPTVKMPGDRLVLLVEPEDGEGDLWVEKRHAACALPRPLRHRDIDDLISAVATGGALTVSRDDVKTPSISTIYPDARVLVVDDAEVNREVAVEALSRFGIRPKVCADGQAAVDMTGEAPFDLVLMDGSMPVMDGFEAARLIRKREASATATHVPIVALTAHVVGAAALAWRDAGMDDVLHKPFSLRDLEIVLGAWLPTRLARPASENVSGPEPNETVSRLLPADLDLFDEGVVSALLERGKTGESDFVVRVFDLYRRHAPVSLRDMVQALRHQDWSGVASAAHALKSMSLNIGAKAVAEFCAAIEKTIREEGQKVDIERTAELHTRLDRTLAHIGKWTSHAAPDDVVSGPISVTGLREPLSAEDRLARELEADLDAGRLDMRYQPIFDKEGITIVSAEALVRWPRLEAPVGPDVFVPLAEQKGLIGKLGHFVRRRVMRDAQDWTVPVAVNVSPIELEDGGFTQAVGNLLVEQGYPAERLVLEMTETAVMNDPLRVEMVFGELQGLGIKLALDDFGAGYSSLTALHRFPFDKVKIDKVFVTALEGEHRSALEALAIIQAVTGLGRAFGMQVIAEGVETSNQHRHLKAAGVHGLQGYMFAKPMTAGEFTQAIRSMKKQVA